MCAGHLPHTAPAHTQRHVANQRLHGTDGQCGREESEVWPQRGGGGDGGEFGCDVVMRGVIVVLFCGVVRWGCGSDCGSSSVWCVL